MGFLCHGQIMEIAILNYSNKIHKFFNLCGILIAGCPLIEMSVDIVCTLNKLSSGGISKYHRKCLFPQLEIKQNFLVVRMMI